MKRTLVLTVAALAAGLQGCSTFYAEAEQPYFCLTPPAQTFTIPGGGQVATQDYTAAYSSTIDLGVRAVLPDFVLDGPPSEHVLHFLAFDASVSGSPGANLDLVESLQVTANGPPGSQPVDLAHYLRGTARNLTRISLESDNPGSNLTGMLVNGGLSASVEGTVTVAQGQTIPASFSAQFTACFSASVKKTLDQLVNGG